MRGFSKGFLIFLSSLKHTGCFPSFPLGGTTFALIWHDAQRSVFCATPGKPRFIVYHPKSSLRSVLAHLQTHVHSSSEKGLSSVSTLIVGTKSAILIDRPSLIPDALAIVSWIKSTTPSHLAAVFITHHHPDHCFSANPILEAWPQANFATPYVRAGIDCEYVEKVNFWLEVFRRDNVPETPRNPSRIHIASPSSTEILAVQKCF